MAGQMLLDMVQQQGWRRVQVVRHQNGLQIHNPLDFGHHPERCSLRRQNATGTQPAHERGGGGCHPSWVKCVGDQIWVPIQPSARGHNCTLELLTMMMMMVAQCRECGSGRGWVLVSLMEHGGFHVLMKAWRLSSLDHHVTHPHELRCLIIIRVHTADESPLRGRLVELLQT